MKIFREINLQVNDNVFFLRNYKNNDNNLQKFEINVPHIIMCKIQYHNVSFKYEIHAEQSSCKY